MVLKIAIDVPLMFEVPTLQGANEKRAYILHNPDAYGKIQTWKQNCYNIPCLAIRGLRKGVSAADTLVVYIQTHVGAARVHIRITVNWRHACRIS